MSRTIGIDLGTTNSCVAVMEGGEPVIIPNAEGGRTTPSVVAFSKTGERMVGQIAKRQAVTNHDRTISSIKRQMGTNYKVSIDGHKYTPQEISAMILQKLKRDAESYLGEPVTDLRRAIGINDKFLLIRDLFGGDGEAYEEAIATLNAFDDFDECMIHIAENYAWNPNSDGAKFMMELLERKFA